MIHLSQNHGQFRVGRYYGQNPAINAKDALMFEYEIVSSHEQNYNQIVKNLVTPNTKAVIKTTWKRDWANQKFIEFQDGRIYIIENWQGDEDCINPQSEAFVDDLHTQYYIGLTGAPEAQVV